MQGQFHQQLVACLNRTGNFRHRELAVSGILTIYGPLRTSNYRVDSIQMLTMMGPSRLPLKPIEDTLLRNR
jgi:hypothetical protein